jgi:hypothetical protein
MAEELTRPRTLLLLPAGERGAPCRFVLARGERGSGMSVERLGVTVIPGAGARSRPAATTGSGTSPSSPRWLSNKLEVTGRATSKLRDVRLGRPAAQDVALGGRLG